MRRSIRSHHTSDPKESGRTKQQSTGRRVDGRAPGQERAMLVCVLVPETQADLSNPLGELAALAESVGVEVVDCLVQKRMRLTASHALGKGKVQELVERADAADADVIIFDNDLTPRQVRSLEKSLEMRVIDRSELVLDIFASRAKTHEAQLQVELAQLQYTAPRLRGMWTHLERIAGAGGGTTAGAVGGVGTRGPGERQIEIDRRLVKDRIVELKRRIDAIDRRVRREVQERTGQFTVSLVGYTNAGKTSLMNRLAGTRLFAADKLFATLDTKTVKWDLGDGLMALLSDTVGFVRDLPHHLVASFRATLEQAIHASLLLHVVDVSSPLAWRQIEAVDKVLAELGCTDVPQILVLNKADIANEATMAELLARGQVCCRTVSALTGHGVEELLAEVRERALGAVSEMTVLVPHSAGKLLTAVQHLGQVRERRYVEAGVELDLRINPSNLEQLRGRFPDLVIDSSVGSSDNQTATPEQASGSTE